MLGRLFRTELAGQADALAEAVVRSRPSTFRPNVSVEEMTRFMRKREISTAVVTTSDGRLVGLFRRDESEGG